MTAKIQIEQFRTGARDLETDDDEARFDERLGRLAQSPPPKNDKQKKARQIGGLFLLTTFHGVMW